MTEPPSYPGPGETPGQPGSYGSAPGGGGYPPPGGQPAYQGGGGQAPNNQKAIWSLVTGILSLVCCGPLGIVAIILGRQAQTEIAQTRESGEGMAKAGFICGIIGLVLMVAGIIFYIVVIAAASSTSGDF